MEVSGSISGIFKGIFMEMTEEELTKALIGKPIKDTHGNTIGFIERVDIPNDKFYGTIL